MRRKGTAIWQGNLKEGKGQVSTESGVLSDASYSFGTRFETARGTNPEELIAAAHAACFSMALSAELVKAGLTADSIQTNANVDLEKNDSGWSVARVHLDVSAKVPQASREVFDKAASDAKSGCPVSKLLKAEITMEARLET